MSKIYTVLAPVNIAVIKYWGKRDEDLILPLNDSVSATLDTSIMYAKTSVCAWPDFKEDEFWLNGKRESFNNKRLQNCLQCIKARAIAEKSVDEKFLSWKVHICSANNFPTAAGLASSAAGYAGLVVALAKLYNVQSDVSSIARLGSGSACRSVYGGFVRWCAGSDPLGTDSIALQVSPGWPRMRALILVVAEAKKKKSSTEGMKTTAQTSELLKHRIKYCVPERTAQICDAIQKQDFKTFAEITMKDSNQFHAVCLDSYPSFSYMNDTSHSIIEVIQKYNELCGEPKVAYTFDAGPNACLYLLEEEVAKVFALISHVFPSTCRDKFVRGLHIPIMDVREWNETVKKLFEPKQPDQVMYILHTKVGDGPIEVTDGSHLLDEIGLPTVKVDNVLSHAY